jgi:hypothetical protein
MRKPFWLAIYATAMIIALMFGTFWGQGIARSSASGMSKIPVSTLDDGKLGSVFDGLPVIPRLSIMGASSHSNASSSVNSALTCGEIHDATIVAGDPDGCHDDCGGNDNYEAAPSSGLCLDHWYCHDIPAGSCIHYMYCGSPGFCE